MEDLSNKTYFLNANKGYYRFVVLFFNCLLTFGSYFCFDMPSVLQDNLTGKFGWNCTTKNGTNITTCGKEEHLGLTETQYNLLYTVMAWMNACVVIGSGVFIDKFGQRVGAILFSALCVIGTSIFAAGYFFKGTPGMFGLFLLGRLLFGAGNGSVTLAQNRISAYWFEGKELAFAFGMGIAASRLGSIFNFLYTESIEAQHGMEYTLWTGAILCILGFLSSLVLFFLDKHGQAQLKRTVKKGPARKMRLSDIRKLSFEFWLLVLTTVFFNATVFPFVADASKFIEQKYHFRGREPAYIAGTVYDVAPVITPLFGLLVDYFGRRGIIITTCAILSIPVFAILGFTTVNPIAGTILLGATYSAAVPSLKPSVPLLVDSAVLGTALGLMTSVQMLVIGSCNLIVGSILDHSNNHWEYVMLFLFANAIACVIFSIFLNIVDTRGDAILHKTKKKKRNARPLLDERDQYIEPLLKEEVKLPRSRSQTPSVI